MKAWVVVYCTRDTFPGPTRKHISQEAYSSLEQAQDYCIQRGGKEVTPCRFEVEGIFRYYEITDVTII